MKSGVKSERTRRRNTKSSVDQVSSPPPVPDGPAPEPAAGQSSPGENSFIYSPSRRRQTRGEPNPSRFMFLRPSRKVLTLHRFCVSALQAESSSPSEESEAPVTRSRSRVKDASVQVEDSV